MSKQQALKFFKELNYNTEDDKDGKNYRYFHPLRVLNLSQEIAKKEKLEKFNYYIREVFKDRTDSASIDTRFKLAELYLFELNKPDSALSIYCQIESKFSDPQIKARAVYARAWIYQNIYQLSTKADSLFQYLITQFPQTIYADSVKKQLGETDVPPAPALLAKERFRELEDQWVQQGVNNGIVDEFLKLARDFAQTPIAPKAIYAAAWLCDYALYDTARAHQIYELLINRYPQTKYAQIANRKSQIA